jgi:6-phosphofructokinase 1
VTDASPHPAPGPDTRIRRLGPAGIESPLTAFGHTPHFITPEERVLLSADLDGLLPHLADCSEPPTFELAGPRELLHFDPAGIVAGIVTCGGLCPGLNNVIRSIVLTLTHTYGVDRIWGFRYGFAGIVEDDPGPLELTPQAVDGIHEHGGTLLGSSRGPQSVETMVDRLQALGVSMLFVIGGDGSLRGALALTEEIARRGADIAIVGVPKTIDNDLQWIERSFGFATAVEEATRVCYAAHAEARGARNGIGLVKLMGREAGFIAAHATLASSDVNYCLVPEVPFDLHGPGAFLDVIDARLADRHHAVIVVAEGAGQEHVAADPEDRDPSGNKRLGDIGVHLERALVEHLGPGATVKYLDPSYSIRSLRANAVDAEFCLALGQHAVHAAMAGCTALMIGYWNQRYTHVPIEMAISDRRHLDPDGDEWQRVLQTTGQPVSMRRSDGS